MQKFGSSAQYIPVNSIKDVFSEVERGRAHFGVVPIENTTEGVVNHTLDMFIDSSLLIYGEVLQEVAHHLMSKNGVCRGHHQNLFASPRHCPMSKLARNESASARVRPRRSGEHRAGR